MQKYVKTFTGRTASLVLMAILAVSTFTVVYNVGPKAEAADTCENQTATSVMAEGDDGNVPSNVMDNDLETRWSDEGIGSWITMDLGEEKTICDVSVAWYKGDTRTNDFVISVSTDGDNFSEVYSGKSSGQTTSAEKYDLDNTDGRYVKITVNGNSDDEWASITAIGINGYSSTGTVISDLSLSSLSDSSAPQVTITSPADGSSVAAGTIKFSGIASEGSEGNGINVVEVRVDDGSYYTATPKAPGDWSTWSVSLDIPSPGHYRIVPRVTDNAGTQNWHSTYIDVIDSKGGDDPSPQVTITSPADGSSVAAGTIKFSGIASEGSEGNGINVVEVRVDDGSYYTATPKAPGDWSTWSVSLDIPSPGHYRIVPRVTDNAGTQNWHSIHVDVTTTGNGGSSGTTTNDPSNNDNSNTTTDPQTPPYDTSSGTGAGFDNFGVQEIYPSKQGGPQWYVSMDDGPVGDSSVDNIDNLNFKKMGDGSWQIKADNGQVRLEAQSPKNDKWLNVEITEYAKIESTDDELLQLYARGGHHSTKDPCLGTAYKARLYGDGRASWVKEVTHPAYAGNKGVVQNAISDSLEGRWVGFKAVVYNMVDQKTGDTYVRLESYVDDDVTDSHGNLVVKNNWKLASVYEDKGGWSTNDSDFDSSCGRDRDEVLTGPGGTSSQNLVAWRTDDTVWDFKYLSVREISAP